MEEESSRHELTAERTKLAVVNANLVQFFNVPFLPALIL